MTNFMFFQKYKNEFLRRASMHHIYVVFLGCEFMALRTFVDDVRVVRFYRRGANGL